MSHYYDRDGQPISLELWARLLGDYDYKMVITTEFDSYIVSTVWLGLDHRFTDEGPPIIFETMVFSRDEWNDPEHFGLTDIDCRRYATEDEAMTGHRETVELIMATLISEEDILGPQPTPEEKP